MNSNRIKSLDFLKIIATICIILPHYQIYTFTRFDKGINFDGGIFYFGYLVELFFIISGIVTYNYIEKIKNGLTFASFFFPKYVRFLLPQIVSCVVFSLLIVQYEQLYGCVFFDRKASVWGTIVAALGLSEGWGFSNPKINGTLWYVSVLLICYCLFYFIVWLSGRLSFNPTYGFCVMIFLGIAIQTYNYSGLFCTNSTARGYISFFFGVILAGALPKLCKNNRNCIVSGILACILCVFIFFKKSIYFNNGQQFLYSFIIFPLIIIFFNMPWLNSLFHKMQFLQKGAAIAFEAYVWHFPIIILFMNINQFWKLNIDYCSRKLSLLVVLASFIVGAGAWFLLERLLYNFIFKNSIPRGNKSIK